MGIEIGKKQYEPIEVINQANRACGWFGAIAIFSIINSVLAFSKSDTTFVIGLGITTFIDALASHIRQETQGGIANFITIIGFVINLILIGVFVLIWFLSKRGSKTVYIIGMVLYALDTLIFLVFKIWMGLAFHAFFLYCLIGGLGFINARAQAESMHAAAAVIPNPATPEIQADNLSN
ncbi:MAG: hypothetical protein LLF92_08655 [Planctomycetaceae bacterium]|nr:hypothetical protein [Planctomycetaceae bacterium]